MGTAAGGDARHLRIDHVVLSVGGEILKALAGELGGKDELLGVVEPLEDDLGRRDGELLDLWNF